MNITLALAKARFEVARKSLYFTQGVRLLQPQQAPANQSTAFTVAKDGRLFVAEKNISDESKETLAAELVRNFLHLFVHSASRFDNFVAQGMLRDVEEDRQLHQAACDASISSMLREMKYPLKHADGRDPVTPDDIQASWGGGVDDYITHLIMQRAMGAAPEVLPGGSGTGYPLPDEPPPEQDNNEGDPDPNAVQVDALEMLEATLQKVANDLSKDRGKLPQNLARLVPEKIVKKKPSAAVLRAVMMRATSPSRIGQAYSTYAEKHRAHEALRRIGTHLPGERCATARVAFAVDTSGSVSHADVEQAYQLVANVLRVLPGCEISLLSCDTDIHTNVYVRAVGQLPKSLGGGGGTSFKPIFDWANKLPKSKRPNVLVYITDGYGDAQEIQAPPGVHTVWCITPGGHNYAQFGECVELHYER